MFEGVQAVLVVTGLDDVAVVFRCGVEIVVVVIQAGVFQRLGLLGVEHAQGGAGFHAQGAYAADHFRDLCHIAVLRRPPGGAHAEARGAGGLGLRGFVQHILERHQFLRLQAGVVARGLRAVGAVFRAAAGLDRQQGGDLHLVRVEALAVDLSGFVHQVGERQVEQGQYFGTGIIISDDSGHGGFPIVGMAAEWQPA